VEVYESLEPSWEDEAGMPRSAEEWMAILQHQALHHRKVSTRDEN
jgi:hypothetical protein